MAQPTITGAGSFTVDNAGAREAIAIPALIAPCHRATIWEPLATTGFKLSPSATGSATAEFAAGASKIFQRNHLQRAFEVGEILGYIETLAGTATFNILCEEILE